MARDSIDEKLDNLIAEAEQMLRGNPLKGDNSYYSRTVFPAKKPIREIFNDIPMRQRFYERVVYSSGNQQKKMKDKFFRLIQESDIFKHPSELKDQPEIVFQEALAKTQEWFIRTLLDYDPLRKSPISWFEDKLKYVIRDVYKEIQRDEEIENKEKQETKSEILNSHYGKPHSYISQLEGEELLEKIYDWIEDDKNKKRLMGKHLAGHVNIDCYSLFCKRLPKKDDSMSGVILDGMEWDLIIQDLGLADDKALRKKIMRHYNEKCLRCLASFLTTEGYSVPEKGRIKSKFMQRSP